MGEKMFKVGKIINTHGIRGDVKVLRITDFEERFEVGSTLYLVDAKEQESIPLEIETHRVHKGFDLLRFKGYGNINEVEVFKGSFLKIKESQLTELPDGEYYYHEIISCEVYTVDGERLGKITEVLAPGANDVWVVKRSKGKDALIPYIPQIVKQVDISEKKVIIEPMEGLLD
ncbi:ribosome maturation factor RimM [Ornithinibacillus sp. 4-3]|uniref:Ribosome maturation factor RimM n=1 Tax=Ornithinibacillus sp. 4-3 TaxID=3231488 RepID=A0AB39HVW9_9BACI